MSVIVWSKKPCVQCNAVKRALKAGGVEFEERNLPDFPEELEAFKDMGFMGAPVVEAAGLPAFAGFEPDSVNAVIARHGVGN
jgi:glutaredoxin-like protein NrdH